MIFLPLLFSSVSIVDFEQVMFVGYPANISENLKCTQKLRAKSLVS